MPTKFSSRKQELHRLIDKFRARYCGGTMLTPRQYNPNQPDIDRIQAAYVALVQEYDDERG